MKFWILSGKVFCIQIYLFVQAVYMIYPKKQVSYICLCRNRTGKYKMAAGGWRRLPVVGRVWLVTDCCGLVCAGMTWGLGKYKNQGVKLRFLVAFGLYAFLVLFFIPAQWSISLFIDTILFNSFAFLAVMSHFKAMTSGKTWLTSCQGSHYF